MAAFIPLVMTATPSLPHPQSSSAASSPRRPNAARIVHSIREAVRSDHLGLALTLLKNYSPVRLPEDVADELAGRLRMRKVRWAAQEGMDDVVSLLGTVTPHDWVQEEGIEREVQLLLKRGKVDEAIGVVKASGGKVHATVVEMLVQAIGSMGQIKKCANLVDVWCRNAGVHVTPRMVAGLVDAYGKAGNVDRAVAVLNGFAFKSLDSEEKKVVYERLVNACVKCRELERAEQIMERMRTEGVARTEGVYEALLYGVARRGCVEKCLAVFEIMRNDGFVPGSIRVYNALIMGCSRAAKVEEAMKFYNQVLKEGLVPNLDTFNALLSCCARAGKVDKAFAVLEEMQQAAGLLPNPKSYNWVVVACANVADVDRAFQVARKMRRQGMSLNVVTKNNLIEACCNAGRLERAFTIVKSMVREERLAPNAHTYNTLIKGCGRWGQLDAALRLLTSMRTAGVSPTVVTYSVAVDACARTGGPIAMERAFELVDDMRKSGLEPNTVTYNSLIHACAKANDVQRAFGVLDRMKREKVTPDNVTLCSLVDACGRARMIGKAFAVMRSLPRQFSPGRALSLPVYNALLHGCYKAKDIEAVNTALGDMRRLKLQPNVVTFSTVISAHAVAGDVDKVLSVLEEMRAVGLRPNQLTFTSVITAYGQQGKVSSAMEIFEQARKLYGEPDQELYTSAIVAAIRGGKVDMAIKLSREMNRAGYSVSTVLNGWMRRSGDDERSGEELRNILSAMQALKIRPKRGAVESLLAAYAKEGNVDASFALLPEMSKMGYAPDLRCYRKVIECCALSGEDDDIDRACALFRRVRTRSMEDKEARFQSHEWVELYAEAARAARGQARISLLQEMAEDCGLNLARDVARKICAEYVGILT